MPQLLNIRTILTADYFYIKVFLTLEANLWWFTLEIFGKHMRYLRCGQRSAVSGQPSAVSRQPWAFGPRCLRCFVAQALALAFGHATRMATLCERPWDFTQHYSNAYLLSAMQSASGGFPLFPCCIAYSKATQVAPSVALIADN
ncbi:MULTISPECIES: hypothetical protein [unclassified Moorena]|uniref:hypothetical protein n=1 Tax=unclassified Moorena TaxID=2683338 RepID=UPI0013FFE090|nr:MULTISPECIES: hypothetical protein [unclassified Moorena]NEO13571.1 hypothetical protein [Moorena sp. SIO3E8]NEP99963.1 hypothetical protein [Moorena sp. SIO3F7]